MEGRKESKYNLAGICAECGKPIKIELTIATELVENGTTKETEGKDNGLGNRIEEKQNEEPKSESVRHDREQGNPAKTSGDTEPTDSEKSAGTKKTGGGKAK